MQFVPFEELHDCEVAAGHDMLLGSCYNFASADEQEDGCAIYIGQGEDVGDRCVLIIDRNGLGTMINAYGNVVAQDFELDQRLDLLNFCSWLVSLKD